MRRTFSLWLLQGAAAAALGLLLNAAFGTTVSVAHEFEQAAPVQAVAGDGCAPGFTGSVASGCTDVNECATNNGGCNKLSRCTNTPGSRTCGGCPDGFAGDGYIGCFDVNECPAGDCTSKMPVVNEGDPPPAVTSSGDVSVAAASDAGAPASFTASAKDAVDGTLKAFCSPRSGATFAVGKTTVTCWAYNSRGQIGRTTLTVTVTK